MPPPDVTTVEAELTDFSVFGTGSTPEALERAARTIADANRVLSELGAPGQGALADDVAEKLAEYQRRAHEAGLDLSTVASAVADQHRVISDHLAAAPTDEEIEQAQQAVDDARAALADGTGTQADVDAAVAHLNDLLDRRQAADDQRDLDTMANTGIVEDPASVSPPGGMPQIPQMPGGMPSGSPAGSPAGTGATPGAARPQKPMTPEDLNRLMGGHSSPAGIPGLAPLDTLGTDLSSSTQAVTDRGSSLSGLATKENISGRTSPTSPFPVPPPAAKGGAAPSMGGGGMGGMPMAPMGGMGGAGKSDKEKTRLVDPDDELNNTESVKHAADGGVISANWRR